MQSLPGGLRAESGRPDGAAGGVMRMKPAVGMPPGTPRRRKAIDLPQDQAGGVSAGLADVQDKLRLETEYQGALARPGG